MYYNPCDKMKCRKDGLQASVFYIFEVFSNVAFYLCNTQLRLLYLFYDIGVMYVAKKQ